MSTTTASTTVRIDGHDVAVLLTSKGAFPECIVSDSVDLYSCPCRACTKLAWDAEDDSRPSLKAFRVESFPSIYNVDPALLANKADLDAQPIHVFRSENPVEGDGHLIVVGVPTGDRDDCGSDDETVALRDVIVWNSFGQKLRRHEYMSVRLIRLLTTADPKYVLWAQAWVAEQEWDNLDEVEQARQALRAAEAKAQRISAVAAFAARIDAEEA